jgi:hypothetical protein
MPHGRAGPRVLLLLLALAAALAVLLSGRTCFPQQTAHLGPSRDNVRPSSAGPAFAPIGDKIAHAPERRPITKRSSQPLVAGPPTPTSTSMPALPRASPVLPRRSFAAGAAALPPDVQTAIPVENVLPGPRGSSNTEVALLEVQLGRLTRRVMKTYGSGDQLLLPLAAWLELAEVSHDVAGRRITGRLQPAHTTFVIDGALGTAQLGRRRLPLADGDLRVVDGEVYASLRLLSELFGVTGGIDREGAALLFYNPEDLPVARRLRREAARSIQAGGDGQIAADRIYRGPEVTRPGLVLSYDVRGSSLPSSPTSYTLAAGTGAAGGSAVLRADGSSTTSPRFEGGWARVWPGQRWLTQLRLGDGVMSGPRPENSRGFSISNAPIARTLLVEDLPFTGALPPDWSVEAYRAGHLVAFDSVDASGRYALTLPIQYGENPVDFVAYGPFGEVRTFNRTFRALPTMVPAGAWEYGVSAGACRTTRCDATANVDLRHGLSRRWTIRAGLDQVWGGGRGASSYAYSSVVGAPSNALGVEMEGVAHRLYRTSLRLEPSTRVRLTGDYVSYAHSDSASPLLQLGPREQWSLYGRLMPGRRTGAVVLEAQATRTLTSSGMRTEARTGAALQLRSTVLRPYLRSERTPSATGPLRRSYAGMQATVLPQRSLGPLLSGFWLQGQVEAEGARSVTTAAAVVARNLGQGFRIEAGTRWDRTLPGPIFMLSLVSQLDLVRSTSMVTMDPGIAKRRFDQSVGGSVVWGRLGSTPIFSSEPSLDRGGVGGRVFVDLNADGHWQPGEPAAPGTRLLVANRWVTADANGRYQLWGVSPWEELLVSVDTASLASPWWIPTHAAEGVTPAPNLIRNVDVPLIIGGVIEGRVLLDAPSSPPITRPISILLVELGSGTRTVVESFSDGSFYRMGLSPGSYAATAEDGSGGPLGLRADTVRFELRPSILATDAGPSIADLELFLRPLDSENSTPHR